MGLYPGALVRYQTFLLVLTVGVKYWCISIRLTALSGVAFNSLLGLNGGLHTQNTRVNVMKEIEKD